MIVIDEVVERAAQNYRSGKEVIMLLPEESGVEVVVTKEEVVNRKEFLEESDNAAI